MSLLCGLLRDVSGRKGRAFAEEEIFHVFRDQLLRLFLPGHQAIFVEDHLHPILPEFPRLHRDVLVDALTELAGPWRRVEAGELFLKLLAEHHPAAPVADRLRWRGIAGI